MESISSEATNGITDANGDIETKAIGPSSARYLSNGTVTSEGKTNQSESQNGHEACEAPPRRSASPRDAKTSNSASEDEPAEDKSRQRSNNSDKSISGYEHMDSSSGCHTESTPESEVTRAGTGESTRHNSKAGLGDYGNSQRQADKNANEGGGAAEGGCDTSAEVEPSGGAGVMRQAAFLAQTRSKRGSAPAPTTFVAETEEAPVRNGSLSGRINRKLSISSGQTKDVGGSYIKKQSGNTSGLTHKRLEVQEYSCGCITTHNPVRDTCLTVYYNVWFDRIVLAIILLNCLTLAIIDPTSDASSTRNAIAAQSGIVFTVLFTVEMLIKMMALGVIGTNSYFSDRWNWLDFVVVVSGYLAILPSVGNLSSLRILRVLRPLRALQAAPGLRTVVSSMFAALPGLCNILYFIGFTFFFFGIVANQLYQGVLRGRCFYEHPETHEAIPLTDEICGLSCQQFEADGAECTPNSGDSCGEYIVPLELANGTRRNALLGTQCLIYGNPSDGKVGFDNFGMSSLTLFVSVTLEGWVSFYYALNAGFGVDAVNALFFIILILFVPYFIINLTLAILWDEYSKADNERREREKDFLEQYVESPTKEEISEMGNKREGTAGHLEQSSADEHELDVGERASRADEDTKSRLEIFHQKWRPMLRRTVLSNKFELVIAVFILINTLTMAVEHFGMPSWLDILQDWVNVFCTVVFAGEMILKLYALGWREYVSKPFNLFDGTIVFVSVLEVLLLFTVGSALPGISVLRAFRLFRTFKVAKFWKSLDRLLRTIVHSIAGVTYASLLLLVIMFVYILLGMQIFGGGWEAEQKPRPHFDNLWWATVTVFQLLTTENWADVLYDYMAEFGITSTVLYTLSLLLIGNYIILNLFLAILLSNFETENAPEDDPCGDSVAEPTQNPRSEKSPGARAHRFSSDESRLNSEVGGPSGKPLDVDVDDTVHGEPQEHPPCTKEEKDGTLKDESEDTESDAGRKSTPRSEPPYQSKSKSLVLGSPSVSNPPRSPKVSLNYKNTGRLAMNAVLYNSTGDPIRLRINHRGDVATHSALEFDNPEAFSLEETYGDGPFNYWEYSIFIFSPSNSLRRMCSKIISHKVFERFILFVIVYSSVLLAVEEPDVLECKQRDSAHPESCPNLALFLGISEILILTVFIAETVMKIIARGLILEPHSYLRSPWDVLDFFVVLISVVSVAATGSGSLRSLRALRTVRALRPLRVVRRFFGMRLVINAVIGSIPRVSSVVVVNFLFMLIFGIVGVQLWRGALYKCNDASIHLRSECVGTFNLTNEDCRDLPREEEIRDCQLSTQGVEFQRVWEPLDQNFDHIFNALLTVFEVASLELWPIIMYKAVDSTGQSTGPEEQHNPSAAIWFILVQMIFNFFLLEVFTGVVVDYYQSLRREAEGSGLLTKEQLRWVNSVRQMASSKPKRAFIPPNGRFRTWMYMIGSNYYFDLFIMTCIFLNILAMSTRHYAMSEQWENFNEYSNVVFVSIFALEAVTKLIGFGVHQYFSVRWNQFDFAVVVAGLVGLGWQIGGFAAFFRLARVLRLFRLVRSSATLRHMFRSLLISLPALFNILTVLFLVTFIYAIFGMNIFYTVRFGRSLEFHNSDANFRTFWVSFMTLFRTQTGENWNGIMHDLMVQPPFCIEGENCGWPVVAPIFFCSFVLITTYVLVNLFVAVILENFLSTSMEEADESQPFVLTREALEEFQAAWAIFDPKGRNKLTKTEQLIGLVGTLNYPLGLNGHPSPLPERSLLHQVRRLLLRLEIPVVGGGFAYHAVLHALVQNARNPQWKETPMPSSLKKWSGNFDVHEVIKFRFSYEAVAMDILEDFAYFWRYKTRLMTFHHQCGRFPEPSELKREGFGHPGMPRVEYVRMFVLDATHHEYQQLQKGLLRHAQDDSFIHVPPVGVKYDEYADVNCASCIKGGEDKVVPENTGARSRDKRRRSSLIGLGQQQDSKVQGLHDNGQGSSAGSTSQNKIERNSGSE
eukprot:gb/GECG01014323.1/.p1 GENE.gb/GECG01014323.1/~~gb/GECG01014323.1/.p1  ORF type:complete len:1981 (+),score=157.66 gb/GECG01014323.1/:1-5943(+)